MAKKRTVLVTVRETLSRTVQVQVPVGPDNTEEDVEAAARLLASATHDNDWTVDGSEGYVFAFDRSGLRES